MVHLNACSLLTIWMMSSDPKTQDLRDTHREKILNQCNALSLIDRLLKMYLFIFFFFVNIFLELFFIDQRNSKSSAGLVPSQLTGAQKQAKVIFD